MTFEELRQVVPLGAFIGFAAVVLIGQYVNDSFRKGGRR